MALSFIVLFWYCVVVCVVSHRVVVDAMSGDCVNVSGIGSMVCVVIYMVVVATHSGLLVLWLPLLLLLLSILLL